MNKSHFILKLKIFSWCVIFISSIFTIPNISISQGFVGEVQRIKVPKSSRTTFSDAEYTISDANILVHYYLTGPDSTTQAWAESVFVFTQQARAIDSSLGWLLPPPDDSYGGDNRFDVYILSEGGINGNTIRLNRCTTCTGYPDAYASTIAISNGPIYGLSLPIYDALKALIAHEFGRACELRYRAPDPWFDESNATFMENNTFPNINTMPDRFNIQGGYSTPLGMPFYSFDAYHDYGPYTGGLWEIFLNERYGDSIMHKVWEYYGQDTAKSPLQAMDRALNFSLTDLPHALEQYAIWRYFTGPDRADTVHYFKKGNTYLGLNIFAKDSIYPNTGTIPDSLDPFNAGGSAYAMFVNGDSVINLTFNSQYNHQWKVAAVKYHQISSSTVTEFTMINNTSGTLTLPFVKGDTIVMIPVVTDWPDDNTWGGFTYSAILPGIRTMLFANNVHDSTVIGSKLRVREQNSHLDTVTSGCVLNLKDYSVDTVMTLSERFIRDSIYKQINWNADGSNYKLSEEFFDVPQGPPQIANFVSLNQITIRNEIIGAPQFNGGKIDFRDPWYVDSLGNQPDTFDSSSSPFVPMGAYNQSAGGVFLNQGDTSNLQPPYYSVRVPQTQPIGIFQCIFDHWDTSGVSLVKIDSTSGFIQRAVVFRSPNAIIKAMYHATIASVTAPVSNYWNMVSVPVVPASFAKTAIWPTSNSNASTYISGNNVQEDTIHNGIGYWLRFPQADSLHYVGGPITTESIRVNTGWNMIGSLSLPLPKTKVHPDTTIISNYFEFTNYGYYPSDTIKPGNGYWIEVNQPGSLVLDISGTPQSGNGNGGSPPCAPFAPPIPIPASPQSGTTGVSTSPTLSWNATTCATKYRLQVSSNSSFNPPIFDDSTITGTSRQVSGLSYWTEYYWRLSSINGYGSSDWSSIWYFVTLSNNPPPPCQCCANMLTDLDQLSVGDASGNSQRLYVVHGARQLNLGFTNYGLPPETPHGLFGARFGSGRFIESIPADSQSRVSLPIKVKDVTFPLTIKWKLRNENALRYWLTLPGTQGRNKVALNGQTGNTSVSGTDNGVLMLNVQPMMIKPCPPDQGTVQRSGDIDEQKEIPTETKLFPNYPNPFNNSTTFTYQLSAPGIVQMKVYNLLGEEITRLVDNESKDAGYYSATWNADKMASGIYYVRMIITDKTDKQIYQNVNKLILLK